MDSKKVAQILSQHSYLMKTEIQKIFSGVWKPISEVSLIDGDHPGVYLLAWQKDDLDGVGIEPSEIFYVGMSNAKKGVKSRLKQFLSAVSRKTKNVHSAGERMYRDVLNDVSYIDSSHKKQLYFIELAFPCIVLKAKRTTTDLLVMGKVCLLEMELIGFNKSVTNKEPYLNKK